MATAQTTKPAIKSTDCDDFKQLEWQSDQVSKESDINILQYLLSRAMSVYADFKHMNRYSHKICGGQLDRARRIVVRVKYCLPYTFIFAV